jgi:lipopolysaccharide/colanic/teichoic acid biosynthesis glycosyltransferase
MNWAVGFVLVVLVLLIKGAMSRAGARLLDWAIPEASNVRLAIVMARLSRRFARRGRARDEALDLYALLLSGEADGLRPLGAAMAVLSRSVGSRLPTPYMFGGSLDRLFALVALILLGPVLVGIAVAVKLSSPGPVFYRQLRVGAGGRPFYILKFRTMRPQLVFRIHGALPERDPRFTAIGRLLRAVSLEEMPQLFCVLRGEMRLVGPRPRHVGELLVGDEQQLPEGIKPGMASWVAVTGDPDEGSRRDIEYQERWSPLKWIRAMTAFLVAMLRKPPAGR